MIRAAPLLVVLLLAGCGDSPSPPAGTRFDALVAGSNGFDFVRAAMARPTGSVPDRTENIRRRRLTARAMPGIIRTPR